MAARLTPSQKQSVDRFLFGEPAGADPVAYQGTMADNPCPGRTIVVDSSLDDWEEVPAIDLVHSARGERTGRLPSAGCRILREGTATRYEVAIPLRDVALIEPARTKAFGFSLLLDDNDGKGRKGWIELGSGIGRGKAPAQFLVCRIAR